MLDFKINKSNLFTDFWEKFLKTLSFRVKNADLIKSVYPTNIALSNQSTAHPAKFSGQCNLTFLPHHLPVTVLSEECELYNTRIYNLISVPQITQLLLGDAIISSRTDLRSSSKKEKRGYGKVRNNTTVSRILSFIRIL